jgi:hypothetical protein
MLRAQLNLFIAILLLFEHGLEYLSDQFFDKLHTYRAVIEISGVLEC